MKYNLVTKKNIAIAAFIILVIIATVCFDYFRTLNANNQQLTKMLQAVEENPVSSEIKDKDGNNITEDFLKRYKEDFKKGDYSKAIKEIREKQYSVAPAIGLYLKICLKFNCIQISYFTTCPF